MSRSSGRFLSPGVLVTGRLSPDSAPWVPEERCVGSSPRGPVCVLRAQGPCPLWSSRGSGVPETSPHWRAHCAGCVSTACRAPTYLLTSHPLSSPLGDSVLQVSQVSGDKFPQRCWACCDQESVLRVRFHTHGHDGRLRDVSSRLVIWDETVPVV